MRLIFSSVLSVCFYCSTVWAVETTPSPATVTAEAPTAAPVLQTIPANKPGTIPTAAKDAASLQEQKLTAEQMVKNKALNEAKVKALVKDQAGRLHQLEKANLDALAQNQELQLKNDNLGVQVQVLQSERSAQMFLYGAMTMTVGVLLGFFIAGYVYGKRRRQW
ncbi:MULTISPECIES: hypothetical protein [unclassified Acinetobacter]|uniref:hypothetical protein n=1 Tax=unclassified Acinetobacter TaxID=196816 RepID=UPI0029342107|nr:MULTISPECIES: hypothetical protein [unclassified Acinetobacter]WOE30455.1 hypothetical protein QSG84_08515 [Acinetobacter sp. SAAs470]WOE38646.1 hypothetical protein QSG86_02180 [Acinetobacter sp. SAAs474]